MTSELEDISQLFEAVNKNNINKVDELLQSGAVRVDVQNAEENDRTALHIAAHKGRFDLVHLLVDKHHADVNIKDRDGQIPLQLATDRYQMKIVKYLLKKNSILREYAAKHLNCEKVEELFEAVEANDIDKVLELVNAGIDVNSEDNSNFHRSALEVAATLGFSELVQVLIDNGADMEHEDETGESAYHKAVNNEHYNIANFILQRGFKDIYSKDASSSDSVISLLSLTNIND